MITLAASGPPGAFFTRSVLSKQDRRLVRCRGDRSSMVISSKSGRRCQMIFTWGKKSKRIKKAWAVGIFRFLGGICPQTTKKCKKNTKKQLKTGQQQYTYALFCYLFRSFADRFQAKALSPDLVNFRPWGLAAKRGLVFPGDFSLEVEQTALHGSHHRNQSFMKSLNISSADF